jgi:multiple antibiotic resistance protein
MTEKFIRDALMLWATIDPIGNLSIFIGVTVGLTVAECRRIAIKATLYAFFILLGAIVIGQVLLAGMGIQLISLQVAGGLILCVFAFQMIFGTVGQTPAGEKEANHDVAVFPMAVPAIAGPGAIMAVIVLTDNHLYSIPVQAGTVGIMLAVLAVNYGLLLGADPILRIIGRAGAAILVRVMGIILMALSVELILEALGVERWMIPPP